MVIADLSLIFHRAFGLLAVRMNGHDEYKSGGKLDSEFDQYQMILVNSPIPADDMDREIAMAGKHHHLIDIAPDASMGAATGTTDGGVERVGTGGGGGGTERKWLRKLTSATVNTAVLRDLISRTPMLWYLGERTGTIFRPSGRREPVEALHTVRAVAIGPFHRTDRGLQAFPDDAKLPFMRYLQDKCGLDVDGYVAALCLEQDRLRDEFSADGDLDKAAMEILDNEEKLLEMLLLDSCFILVVSLMLSKTGTGDTADSVTRAWSICKDYFILHMAVAQHADDIKLDMLVLENQVPFGAVELLAASCPELKLRSSVEELVLGCFDDLCPKRARRAGESAAAAGQFHHVLNLFHWSRVPEDKYFVLSTPRKLLKIKKESERLFPCVTELRRSAVWFREASSSCGDLDMCFWRQPASPVAVMSVPCFHIHEYTAAVLHNLLAFEKHFYWAHGACVTAHIARMEGLVRCQQDAAMLRKRGILATTRRTDAELVALFRELGEETVGARLPDEYGEMLEAVACHRGRRVSDWCGGFVLHFFPSPWVAVSLAATAALIFVPSMLQTIYTMFSYFNSNSS